MKFNILFFLFLISLIVKAQTTDKDKNAFHLEVYAQTEASKKIYLGSYSEGNIYKLDSTIISSQGKAVFSNKEAYPEGQYIVYINSDLKFQILLGHDQNDIKIFVNSSDVTQSTINGSRDTEIYWDYLRHCEDKILNYSDLLNKLDDMDQTNIEDIAKIQTQLSDMETALDQYQKAQIDLHKGTWFSAWLKGTNSVDIPPISQDKNSSEQSDYNRKYLKIHYFDNIDLTDPRFWHTSYFSSYLDDYISNIVEQEPDSLAHAASLLVEKTKDNDYCYQKMLSHYVNWSLKSKLMGMENVWMLLYENYIKDKNLSWIDNREYASLDSLYTISENCRIGIKAHNLELDKLEGGKISTNNIDAKYTLLYFYSPACKHCVEEITRLQEKIFNQFKNSGLIIVGINIDSNIDNWKSFVHKMNMKDWVNCSDSNFKSKFWMYYDTSFTPAIYLLDKDKKIVAKKIDSSNLEKVLSYYLK